MPSRLLTDLHPRLAELCQQHIDLCAASGVRLLVYMTSRSKLEQLAYWLQGRCSTEAVNVAREVAGLPPISPEENLRNVTNAMPGNSYHEHVDVDGKPASCAYDCVPLDPQGKPIWQCWRDPRNRSKGVVPEWASVVDVGKRLGLEWGGDWTSSDGNHFQLPRSQW